MHRPQSKRARQIHLFFTYFIMVATVIALVTVYVFIAQGYLLNPRDGRIEQGGLLQFDSRPSGATIKINGQNIGSDTAARKSYPAGTYRFQLEKAGYRTWQKQQTLEPGSVLWLDYARLIPRQLTPETVLTFPAVTTSLGSWDNKTMALMESRAPQLTLVDVSGETPKQTKLTLDSTTISKPKDPKTERFKLESWSGDNATLLIRHIYDGKTEWLRINTRQLAANVININTLLGVRPSSVEYRSDNSQQVYLLENGNLRRADLAARTLSGPIATDVKEFSVATDGMITYTTNAAKDTRAVAFGYVSDGAETSQVLRSLKLSSNDADARSHHVATGTYFGTRYLAFTNGNRLEVVRADLPSSESQNPTPTLTPLVSQVLPSDTPLQVSIRSKGRFVVVEYPTGFATYDLELKKFTATKLGGTSAQRLQWIDNYLAWTDRGNQLTTLEFDGANKNTIMPVSSGYDATLSSNGKFLYGFVKTEKGSVELTRVKLTID